MPAGLKRALEAVLARGGPAMAARAVRRRQVLVLAYHNIVPDDAGPAGEQSLHLSIDRFKRQLDLLQGWLTPSGVAQLAGELFDERCCFVITFDDAYRGAVTLGLAELRARELPGTMFVAPGRLGGDQFWWDALAEGGVVPSKMRRYAMEELGGDDKEVRLWARASGMALRDVPDLWRTATIEELQSAVYPGLIFGSHSWSHPNLAHLSPSEVQRELAVSREWLVNRFPERYLPWLAYPYGRYSPETCSTAAACGYVGGFAITGGWTRLPIAQRLAAPRLNVPAGLSDDGFVLRISGLLRS